MLRFFGPDTDRVLIVNLGTDMTHNPMPEPLLAPLEDQGWQVLWSSEQPEYGGTGVPPLYRDGFLHISGESALVLMPSALTPESAPELL